MENDVHLKPYLILTSPTREGLETLVEQRILQGYKPQGGIETTLHHGVVQFIQAVRLEEFK